MRVKYPIWSYIAQIITLFTVLRRFLRALRNMCCLSRFYLRVRMNLEKPLAEKKS